MYKLILLILLCIWRVDAGAHLQGVKKDTAAEQPENLPEAPGFLNPFCSFIN